MRLLLLLCAVIGASNAIITSLLSTVYDVYDLTEKEVHLDKCDNGCVIYAATMGDAFEQMPNGVDPYARNLYIHDNNNGKDLMTIVDLAALVDPTTKVKGRLEIQGPANISVLNTNKLDSDPKYTVVLYVIENAHGGSLPHTIYDIADVAGTVITTSARNVTFISARPYRLEADRGNQVNNVSVVLAGFDSWWSSDFCPVVFETRNSTPSVPFPGFVIQPNTPLVSLFMGQSTQIVLRPSYNFDHTRPLSEDGFITSPGWNGCTKPDRGGLQTFRSPFDKTTDAYYLPADEHLKVELRVKPNFEGDDQLEVEMDIAGFQVAADFGGTSPQEEILDAAKNLLVSYKNLKENEGFTLTYYSDPITYVYWAAPESYCNCEVKDGLPVDWKTTEINLDVVLIIDTSTAMAARLEEAKAMVTSFVSALSTDPESEFYTKIGVIAASDTAEVIYNMSMSSTDNLDSVKSKNVAQMDFDIAMKAAEELIINAVLGDKYRPARSIIYFLTNSEAPESVTGARVFKGITHKAGVIIVNEFLSAGASPTPTLESLASENYYFTNLADDFTNNWVVLCEASCFCHLNNSDFHPFNDDSKSPRTEANRGCFRAHNSYESHDEARNFCDARILEEKQQKVGALVSIHDSEKEFFVNQVAAQYGPKTKYWLGMTNNGMEWNWDDKSTSSFSDWDANQPNTDGGKKQCAYAIQTNGFNVKWTAADCDMDGIAYVCESPPCSVGNKYC